MSIRGKLWKIAIKTSPEADEAVSELLRRVVRKEPVIEKIMATREVIVSVYCTRGNEWNAGRRQAVKRGLAAMAGFGLRTGPAEVRRVQVRREDWAHSWRRHFKPIEIGSVLLIKPSWSLRRAKRGQQVVVLDPGLCFGTGQHPTTRFCLDQLAQWHRTQGPPQALLDVGTGSGILAIAAAKLGYHPVLAVDVDPAALAVARRNAASNQITRSQIAFKRRDIASLAAGKAAIRSDLVCANLTWDLLIEQRRTLVNCVKRPGVLILAGILEDQFDEVRHAFERMELKLVGDQRDGEWRSGAFLRMAKA